LGKKKLLRVAQQLAPPNSRPGTSIWPKNS